MPKKRLVKDVTIFLKKKKEKKSQYYPESNKNLSEDHLKIII